MPSFEDARQDPAANWDFWTDDAKFHLYFYRKERDKLAGRDAGIMDDCKARFREAVAFRRSQCFLLKPSTPKTK